MSEVDLPYFQTVQLYSPEKISWNIYYYDKDEQDSMKGRSHQISCSIRFASTLLRG